LPLEIAFTTVLSSGNNELLFRIAWQVKTTLVQIIALLTFATAGVCGAEKIVIGGYDGLDPHVQPETYPVLLALSGGGARGLATIGILKAFEEKDINVVGIAGTSMGGIIGGLYASGYSADQLDSIVNELNFSTLFSNSPSRKSMFLTRRQEKDRHLLSVRFHGFKPIIPQAITAGQKLTSILTNLTTKATYRSGSDFMHLPIPFKTVSTDIVSGLPIVIDSGSIADAMRATMAFPLAFTGVERDDQILMDGGMLAPVPVDLVRSMSDSNSVVVAVNTTSPLLKRQDIVTPVDIAHQVTTIMTADKLAQQLSHADFVITPELAEFRASDFKDKDLLIQMGYEAGIEAADSIIQIEREREQKVYYRIASISASPNPQDSDLFLSFSGKTLSRGELIDNLKSVCRTRRMLRLAVSIDPMDSLQHGDTLAVNLLFTPSANFRYDRVDFRFTGNTIFSDSTLASLFIEPDSTITLRILKDGFQRIYDLYDSLGFDLVNVKNVKIDYQHQRIDATIDEAIIKRIDVVDNRRTKDWYVRSHFPLDRGEPYSTKRASQGISHIYGTDLFDRVTVDVLPYENGALVKIRVEEKESRQLRLGWHWDDEYNSEEFAELVDDNVAGIGLEYLLHARYSTDRQRYYASLKTDRIFSTYLTARAAVEHSMLERQLYKTDNTTDGVFTTYTNGFDVSVGQQIARLGTASADLILQQLKYTYSDGRPIERLGLRVLALRSVVENLDRIPFPTSGNRHMFELDLAGRFLGGDAEYSKFYWSLETYLPLSQYLNYHPHVALGISRAGLPASEKFYLGGLHSFAGLRTYQLSGDKMFLLSNEMRVKFPLRLYLTFRYDLGDVYHSTDQIKLSNLRHGFGTILGLDSPVGPMEFGYGVTNSGVHRWYLSAGFNF